MKYQTSVSNNYGDVNPDAWYADAILKATAAGVIKGTGTNANPNGNATRQEAVVMLARVMGIENANAPVNNFTDSTNIASWAKTSVNAMVAKVYWGLS